MGRENMDDYNADFLTMLETWDAAVAFWPSRDGQAYQPIDSASPLMNIPVTFPPGVG
jgi:hypothetical protein